MRHTPLALRALVALLAASCAAPQWQRPGTSPEAMREDLAACRAAARERLARAAPPLPEARLDPRFGATDPYSPADRRLEEQRLADACMREKGYTLAPAR
jgi:hypothetical protein